MQVDEIQMGLASIRAKPPQEAVPLLVAGWLAIQGQTLQLPSTVHGIMILPCLHSSNWYEQIVAPDRHSHFARHVYNICTWSLHTKENVKHECKDATWSEVPSVLFLGQIRFLNNFSFFKFTLDA